MRERPSRSAQQAASAPARPGTAGSDPGLLVKCYGAPRPLATRRSPAAAGEPGIGGAFAAKVAWGSSIGEPAGTSTPSSTAGAPQFDNRLLLGPPSPAHSQAQSPTPAHSQAQSQEHSSDAGAATPGAWTPASNTELAPIAAPGLFTPSRQNSAKNGRLTGLSVGQLKQIAHRPSSSPHKARQRPAALSTPEVELAPPGGGHAKVHCEGCARGFACSSATPHGPAGTPDRARCRMGATLQRPHSQPILGAIERAAGSSPAGDRPSSSVAARPRSQTSSSSSRPGGRKSTPTNAGGRKSTPTTTGEVLQMSRRQNMQRSSPPVDLEVRQSMQRSSPPVDFEGWPGDTATEGLDDLADDSLSQDESDTDSKDEESDDFARFKVNVRGSAGNKKQAARRPNSQATKSTSKALNPFKQYEDGAVRLKERRTRLLEDEIYMQDTKADLKKGAVYAQKNIQNKDAEELGDMRVFYGPYSISMRQPRDSRPERTEMKRKTISGNAKSLRTSPEVLSSNSTLRDMQHKLRESFRRIDRIGKPESASFDRQAQARKAILESPASLELSHLVREGFKSIFMNSRGSDENIGTQSNLRSTFTTS